MSHLKSIGIVIYFLIMQVAVTSGIIFLKMILDIEWLEEINLCLETNGILSSEYFSLIFEVLTPTLIAADIIIVLPIFIKAFMKKEKIYRKISRQELFAYISLGIVLNFVVSCIVDNLPVKVSESYNEIMSCVMIGNPFIIFIVTGILAPVVEELIFRYCICNFYRNERVAIIVSALLFGVAHMNLIQSSYAIVLGLILAVIYVKTRNLTTCTIIHLIINTTSVLYEYFPVFPVALIVTGVSLYYLTRRYRVFLHEKSIGVSE